MEALEEMTSKSHDGTIDAKRRRLMQKLNKAVEVKRITCEEPAKGETLKDRADYVIAFSRPLRFGVEYEKHTNNIEKFISDFFKNNSSYPTLYAETNRLCCASNKFRSLVDIFLITRFYFPRISLQTVVKHLYRSEGTVVNAQICQQVKRRVYDGREQRHIRHTEAADELGYTHNDYVKFAKEDTSKRTVAK